MPAPAVRTLPRGLANEFNDLSYLVLLTKAIARFVTDHRMVVKVPRYQGSPINLVVNTIKHKTSIQGRATRTALFTSLCRSTPSNNHLFPDRSRTNLIELLKAQP
jgi:hypothetical protein